MVHFVRWSERGIWEGIFSALAGARCPDRLFIGSSCIKVHRCAGGGKGGLGRNTKLHAVCDAKGRPCILLLTPGNVHDCKVAPTLYRGDAAVR
jgi:transposase